MMSKTPKNWLRLSIFLAGCLLLINFVNFPFKINRTTLHSYDWVDFFYFQPENSLDVVFLGNSHAQCAFIPEIINDVLGIRTKTYYIPGSSIYQTYYAFLEASRKFNQALIVVEPNVVIGGRSQDQLMPGNYTFFDAMPLSLRKITYLVDYFSAQNLFIYFFPNTQYQLDWKTPEEVFSSYKDAAKYLQNRKIETINGGYYPQLTPLSALPSEYTADSTVQCDIPDIKGRIEQLRQLLKKNHEVGGKLAIIQAPTLLPPSYCQAEIMQPINQFQVPYYLINEDVAPSPLWFRDTRHLSTFGAHNATMETIQIISNELGLTINKDKYQYYQSFMFQDYSININDNELTIQLTPIDADSSSQLEYRWEAAVYSKSGENQKLIASYSADYQPLSTFTFPLNKGNMAKILVWIINPDGDYVLEGEFNYFVSGE
ncbi:MAG: hypothetical protein JXA19_04085 [Anaerolineales bacterium]|nr:hypothetical protein [Anaerolineales bacterium]